MKKIRSIVIVCLCAGVALSTTGCGKKKKDKFGGMDGGIIGADGSSIYDDPLTGRPGSGYEEYARLAPVFFAYDSSQVDSSERTKIEDVASKLRMSPVSSVIIEGHCDERGSREYNMALGERRALAVRAYLIGLGVDGARIQTKSLGEEQPAALGHDEDSWQQNRRAEFVLYNE